MVERQLPRTGNGSRFLPLGNSALSKSRELEDCLPSSHFLDDVFCVHGSSIDKSKQKEKKLLNQCLVFSCFNAHMDIYAIRRRNLQQVIDERAHGNAADFARSIERERSQIAQYLSPAYNEGRSIGERVARKIEQEAGLPTGYLDTATTQKTFDTNVRSASIGERRIPLLNYVQAGSFADCGQNFTMEDVEYLLTDLDLSERSFALQIKGDSMRPDFTEGDRIIVDCEISPRPGDFVVAKNSEEEATFKKYRLISIDERGKEIFELVPLNEDYPSMRSDQHSVQIIGTMVEHRKYYRRT